MTTSTDVRYSMPTKLMTVVERMERIYTLVASYLGPHAYGPLPQRITDLKAQLVPLEITPAEFAELKEKLTKEN